MINLITWNFPIYLIVTWVSIHYLLHALKKHTKTSPNRLPPGPMPWPIVGNLLSLGTRPHESLAALARAPGYGPLVSLQLGWVTAVVVSSLEAAMEVLHRRDAVFATRAVGDAATVLHHEQASLVALPPGPRWRCLRRICSSHVFSPRSLEASTQLRREKAQQLLLHLERRCEAGDAVNVAQLAFTTTLNFLSNLFFSVDLDDLSSPAGSAFKQLVWASMDVGGSPNVSDFFPILKPIDLQGTRRRMRNIVGDVFKVFDEMLQRRLSQRKGGFKAENTDVLDALLSIAEDEDSGFEVADIPHLLLMSRTQRYVLQSSITSCEIGTDLFVQDLFGGGTDTTSSTVEWAMTELLRSPTKMEKARAEIEERVGAGNPVQEAHIAELPYLQAVVKETLRLHPPVPFLIPRKVETEVELCGFTLPKNTQVLVNVWAIGRDGDLWENPNSFEPERFLGSELDYRGHDLELIPFGAGCRMCPGLPLAHRMVHLILGSLIHSFRWRIGHGLPPEEIDMDDKFGFTLKKAKPLYAIPAFPSVNVKVI